LAVSFAKGRVHPVYAPVVVAAMLATLIIVGRTLGALGVFALCSVPLALMLFYVYRHDRQRDDARCSLRVLYLRPNATDYSIRDTDAFAVAGEWLREADDLDMSSCSSVEWKLAARNLEFVKLGFPGDTSYREEIRVPPEVSAWRDLVLTELPRCDLVLMVPGKTEGIAWELERLVGAADKPVPLAIIFPPDSQAKAAASWNTLVARHVSFPQLPERPTFFPVLLYTGEGVRHWVVARPWELLSFR
jgi:hypothetical protein